MTINLKTLKNLIQEQFDGAKVEIIDTVGDGNHLQAHVIYDGFSGKSNTERHKMIYDTLGSVVGNEIHALSLITETKKEHNEQQHNSTFSQYDNYNLNDETLVKLADFINSKDVLLFMKGNKEQPMCGFSAQVSNILQHIGVNYEAINVLEDAIVREKIKEYSNWPTIPQLYIKGHFIGGCDIITTMYQSGELQKLINDYKV